ncbi:hypothetical protein JX265_006299 [Neoarthrinium moseri]|uniref:Dipeptidase n=1 Tax=Neoarthrinium moseri TaxID=1658444 RepID=A0A9P9WMC6_9PEZI|nr:hypothetical protein JX265_006299 [Neoarthrinium moseri]
MIDERRDVVITPQRGSDGGEPLDSSEADNSRTTQASLVLHPQSSDFDFFSRFRNPLLAAGFALLLSPLAFLRPGQTPDRPELIDGHNDLPWQLRIELKNRIYNANVDFTRLLGHTDIHRMRQGIVGGQFWSVYVDCDVQQQHFEDASRVVRDTLEQIDVIRRFIDEYPQHLQFKDLCNHTITLYFAFAH